MKKLTSSLYIISILCISLILSSCDSKEHVKYSTEIFDCFDTVISISIYDNDEDDAEEKLNKMKDEFVRYHRMFDRYNDYEGIVNTKTINDNAGIKPVKVPDELFDLISKTLEYDNETNNNINLTIGNIVDLWNNYGDLYREEKSKDEVKSIMGNYIPTDEQLESLSKNLKNENIILDKENKTVFLKDKDIKLELGAVAKGYATEEVVNYASSELGVKALVVSAGGNVKVAGSLPRKKSFKVGIQNPNVESQDQVFKILDLKDLSAVTSGDYQRYFDVDNKRYCHILDAKDFKPTDKYKSVTVIAEDSFLCDFLSTTLFISDYKTGLEICKKFNAEAIWITQDEEVLLSDGASKYLEE